MKLRAACVVVGFLSLVLSLVPLTVAQTTAETTSALPHLIRFSGIAKDLNGTPLTGVLGITFALYSEQTSGAALWLETQNVTADSNGHYVALLGSTKPEGLPADLFNSEQARWAGVQVSGQAEQSRVLLVSAPYALKAGDAETIGGLPPSAFVLAAPVSGGGVNNAATALASPSSASSSSSAIANTSSDVTTTGGTVNAVPLFTTSTNIQNSIVTQSGTTSVSVAGALKLPATGTATSTAGKNSRPQDFVASSFNSSTSTAENQTFQWQAEPASNDTTSPSGTLNLLYGLGATPPSETGLKLSSTGQFTFATGQTFPGTGTITGITTASGSGLAGGGTTGTLSLSVPAAGITNTMLKDSTITLNASTAGGLTVPGAMNLGSTYTIGLKTCSTNQVLQYSGASWVCASVGTGTVTSVAAGTGLTATPSPITTSGTLSINAAVVPQLGVANTFTGNQTVNGSLVATEAVAGTNAMNGSNSATSGTSNGVSGSSSSAAGAGVLGVNNSSGGYGVYGQGSGTASGSAGVYGIATNTAPAGPTYGVYGVSLDNNFVPGSAGVYGQGGGSDFGGGSGVYGQYLSPSETGQTFGGTSGVWGDGSSGGPYQNGVLGTADYGMAATFVNNSEVYPSLVVYNQTTFGTGLLLYAYGSGTLKGCTIDVNGNLSCDGTVNAVVPTDGGARKVSLYAVQSPENWFEDIGSGSLSNGAATIALDPTFTQTVNTGTEYHVFLTPNGDSKGLYVSHKTATSFQVREQGGGTSSIAFDYRIVAKRSGYENVRLADVTAQYKRLEEQDQRRQERARQHRARQSAAPQTGPAAARQMPPAPPAMGNIKPPTLARPVPLPVAAAKPVVAEKPAATQSAPPRN